MSVAKAVGGPGSIRFLVLCCAFGLFLIYVWPKRRLLGRVWLIAVFISYVVLGTPVVAHTIADRLIAPETENPSKPPDTLVVFAGDNHRARVDTALRIYQTSHPTVVVVSGEDWLFKRLTDGGIPWTRMLHDLAPTNTLQQMESLRKYLAERRDAQVALVVSRLQAPRVAALADRMGIPVQLIASAADVEPARRGVTSWIPRYAALRISRDALYEHLALAYYRRAGLIE